MQRGSRFFGRDIDLFRKEATKLEETADRGSLNEEERERWVNAREKWLEAESKKVEMLRQKAKIKRAMEGDENSRMFHAVIRKRMRANEIGGLNVNGLWVEEPTLVKKAALDFFKIKIFSHGPPGPKLRSSKAKRITREEAENLERLFSKEEVWEAIKDHLEDVGGEVKVGVREYHRGILKGRYILDGVLIANEVVEDLRKTKRKGMVFKVDFEKAYDSVEWDFLLDTLKMMGFGDRWCKWIRSCLHSALVLILINGALTEEFKMKKGHRQGDPLAPFLFLVVAECLNVLMREATKKGMFKGIAVGKEKVEISTYNMRMIANSMEWEWRKERFKLGIIKWVVVLAHYLSHTFGLPVGATMNRIEHWKVVVEKMKNKLALWKAREMLFGGRLTLVKSVLGGVEGTANGKRRAWVKWEKVVSDFKKGGLKVGSLMGANWSLLGKWWWKFVSGQELLWVRVIKSIYGSKGGLEDGVRRFGNGKSVWGMFNAAKKVKTLYGRFRNEQKRKERVSLVLRAAKMPIRERGSPGLRDLSIHGKWVLDLKPKCSCFQKLKFPKCMVNTKRMGKQTVNTEDVDMESLREIIGAEVAQVMHETLPGLFEQIKGELAKTVISQVEAAMASRASGSGSSQTSRVTSYKDFTACQPPFFQGQKNPIASTHWLTEMEGAFLTSSCSAEVKVRYASNLLRGPAKDWWNIVTEAKSPEQIAAMSWEQFKEIFKEQYVPQVEI
ncbi:hypothetical protein OSB04_012497 [Centaurea solstitialis]|uniref:Reverse transcriptase domain-containing protein n=1 Tax=Centaurea solstitialis TaxID=347529 RepID=A0AA38TJ08_9ASTR|nr:hypothetical protein OSB04_012497 [Centaurea solstitialis]